MYLKTGDLDFSDFRTLGDPQNVAATIQTWMSGDDYAAWNSAAVAGNADPQVLDDAFAKLLQELSHA